jgi:hypothetical protein
MTSVQVTHVVMVVPVSVTLIIINVVADLGTLAPIVKVRLSDVIFIIIFI